MVAQPDVTTLRVVATTADSLSIIITIGRLVYRSRRVKLWWDDAWAAASMVAAIVLLTGMWIHSEAPGVGPVVQSHQTRVNGYILVSYTYSIVLWFARMSILFSVIRIVPWMLRMRRMLYGVAVFFIVMTITLIGQKAYVCFSNTAWQKLRNPQCHLGRTVGITEFTTDFVADTILIVAPMNLLWRVKLPPNQRKLLFVVFSTSILTTLSSIVHGIMLLGPSGTLEAMTAHLEAAVSLIVCNLSVVVTFLYRNLSKSVDLEKSEPQQDISLAFNLTNISVTHATVSRIDPRDHTVSAVRFDRHASASHSVITHDTLYDRDVYQEKADIVGDIKSLEYQRNPPYSLGYPDEEDDGHRRRPPPPFTGSPVSAEDQKTFLPL